MLTHPFLNVCCLVGVCFLGFVHSSSSSLVSCSHLSPTASNSNLPCIGRWLTSVKLRCKVDVHWFNKIFGPIRTSHILLPQKWLEICKCQWTLTPHQRTTIDFAGNKLKSFTSRFPYSLETLCPYFEKYECISVLLANFRTNTGKYGRVGRSEWKISSPGKLCPRVEPQQLTSVPVLTHPSPPSPSVSDEHDDTRQYQYTQHHHYHHPVTGNTHITDTKHSSTASRDTYTRLSLYSKHTYNKCLFYSDKYINIWGTFSVSVTVFAFQCSSRSFSVMGTHD